MLERLNVFDLHNSTEDAHPEKISGPYEGYFFRIGTTHRVYMWLVVSLHKRTPYVVVIYIC